MYTQARIVLIGTLLLAACAPLAELAIPTLSPSLATAEGRAIAVAEVGRLVNAERVAQNLSLFRQDARYAAAAQYRADQIVATGAFDHRGAAGTEAIRAALEACGIDTRSMVAEILVVNGFAHPLQGAAAAVMAWMGSEDHRPVILEANLELFGVGVTWIDGSSLGLDSNPAGNWGMGAVYVLLAGREPPAISLPP